MVRGAGSRVGVLGQQKGNPEQLKVSGEERLVGSHDDGHSELL